VAYQRVKRELNINRFTNRLEFALALTASESLAQTFISHAVAPPAFWAVQQHSAII